MNKRSPHLEELEAVFGRSAQGFAVARVGDTAFAMLPLLGGGHYLARGWKIGRPLAEWIEADFYSHGGRLADEAEFQSKVKENAEHQRELRKLDRRHIVSRIHTPWGLSQGAVVYAEGIVFHATASHGGFHLASERNALVHALLRSDGWYEEDAEWAIVALTFSHLFTTFERRCAEQAIRDWHPDAWEEIYERVLDPGESQEKDRHEFRRRHAGNWVVISAILSTHHPGFTETVATLGGYRRGETEERHFLVPSNEYRIGRFGFVIDEMRHRRLDLPSEPDHAARD